jgi:hypothetical protein
MPAACSPASGLFRNGRRGRRGLERFSAGRGAPSVLPPPPSWFCLCGHERDDSQDGILYIYNIMYIYIYIYTRLVTRLMLIRPRFEPRVPLSVARI